MPPASTRTLWQKSHFVRWTSEAQSNEQNVISATGGGEPRAERAPASGREPQAVGGPASGRAPAPETRPRLLLYSIYYWPEVASTAQIYTDLCESLTDDFDVTVICAVPCYEGEIAPEYQTEPVYREEHAGVSIVRIRVPPVDKRDKLSRVRNILAFWRRARSATRDLGGFDVVMTCSQPPILGGMLGVFGKRATGGRLAYGIQDMNPEQTMAVGYAGGRLTHRAMLALDKRSCRRADLVITVGRDMRQTLESRFAGGQVPRNVVINNWADDESIRPLPKDDSGVAAFRRRYGLEGKFVVMYSGNLGLYYDLPALLDVFAEFAGEPDVAFAFVGDGAVRADLERIATERGMKNVVFAPYQDKADLACSLAAADVHLVCNAKGIKGVSVPSKIYGVMAAGVPVLGVLEEGSEVWRIVEESGCGILAHAGDYDEVRSALGQILDGRERFVEAHSTGREYLEAHLAREKSIAAYREVLTELAEG